MTIEQFAKKTGWPLDELDKESLYDFTEILSLMGLRLIWNSKKNKLDIV